MAKVSKRLRYEILRRDGFRCRYCGATPAETELRIDHVIPEALGGSSAPSNLATSCDPCNNGKSSVPPEAETVDEVLESALQWTNAMQAAAALKEADIAARNTLRIWFQDEWKGYTTDHGSRIPLPGDWEYAIDRIEAAGLTSTLFLEAIKAAMRARNVLPENRFRYFCGVAWNMVSDVQQAALEIVVEGERRPRPERPKSQSRDAKGVAEALDAAMDASGISLESWQYDELVTQLAHQFNWRV